MNVQLILDALKSNEALRTEFLSNFINVEGAKDFIERANKAYLAENIGAEVSKIYNGIDEDVFLITGKRKKSDQKTYDFVKEIVSEYKTKAEEAKTPEEVKALKGKIVELEEKLKNGETSEYWKKGFEEMKGALATVKNEYEAKIKELQDANLITLVEKEIDSSLNGLKFNSVLPQTVVDIMVKTAKEDLKKGAKIIDGKVVFHDAEGKVIRNNAYENASAKELIETSLKDILEKQEPNGGGGAPPKGKGSVSYKDNEGKKQAKLTIDKEAFKTKLGFNKLAEETLLTNGITKGSSEWFEMIKEAYEEHGVKDLPLN